MRRLALLCAGGAIWLFLAAIPVFADGGPHVSSINNGSGGINADSCAGCHRAHTAQGPYLIQASDEEALCLTCHGSAVAGATTDVMTGVQYALGTNGLRGTPQLGALRNGGFDQARLDTGNAARLGYLRSATAVSFRPKVGVKAAQDVTSAHLDLDGADGVVASGIAWGNGANGSGVGATGVSLTCASCHNPHGNGQYRILNPIPEADGAGFDGTWVATIVSSTASNERVTTAASHGLLPGDKVTIAGHTGSTPDINGSWTVAAVPSSTTFTLTGVDITAGGTGGTVTRTGGVTVADSPVDPDGNAANGIENPTKNYTVIQVKGTQGTNSTYMLYARDVEAAALAGSFNSIPGTYGPTGGDYFHRAVPWNPSINNPTCDPTVFVPSPGNPACATADDAPNGRPGVTGDPTVSFNLQITQWCSACHTRYFADNNPNPGTLQGPPASPVSILTSAATGVITTGANHGLAAGDTVTIAGHTGSTPDINGSWTVATAPSTTTFTLTGVTITVGGTGGTSTRTSQAVPPATAQSWWFPRQGDNLYKYQHRTIPNRACTTCHVSHGSNAQMTGPFSVNQTMPNGSAKIIAGATPLGDSRLLKIDNRGTCQACHDPTGTIPAGTYVGPTPTPAVP